jgi:hypothetical protein
MHPISVAVLRKRAQLVKLRSAVARRRQSSKKKLSSLIAYRDARKLVRITLPAASISATIRVSVAISGKSADQPTPPWARLQGLQLAFETDHSLLGGLGIKRRAQQVHHDLLQPIPLTLEI